MNNKTIIIKIKERLNKLDSQDFQNIQPWKIVEAFNKAQLDWCRRNQHGSNLLQEGDEGTTSRIDDFEKLIVDGQLTFVDKGIYYQSTTATWPADYMRFKRVSLTAKNDCCDKPKRFIVYLGKESDVDDYLNDVNIKPSYPWGRTFCTLTGNKLNIYHDGQFTIDACGLIYYRKPLPIQMIGVVDLNTQAPATVEVECELKDDLVEVIIEEAYSILAGDIGAMDQSQKGAQAAEKNN